MKAKRLGAVLYTDKNLPAETRKDYLIYVSKNIAIFFVWAGLSPGLAPEFYQSFNQGETLFW